METDNGTKSIEEWINEVLVHLFHEIMDIEQNALITEDFKDISINDMHIIEAIGVEEPRNMSTIAKKMSVTMGTLTTSMNQLVKKGYVTRERSEADRRIVYIRLTDKGVQAYRHHAGFHQRMSKALLEGMSLEEQTVLTGTLERLSQIVETYR